MPFSDTRFDVIALAVLRYKFRNHRPRVLDIGAGAGKWAGLIGDLCESIDAVEVWRHNLDEYDLRTKYREVFCEDVTFWNPGKFTGYDLLIAGDVLEHLSVTEAQKLLTKARLAGCEMLVQVPFLYIQGEIGGNPHECHQQPDLTQELMAKRYPELFKLHADDRLGLYLM